MNTIPRIEKFLGVLDNIEVTEPINVSIDCKRVSFGLRVNVNNLTKGSILMENSSMGDTLTPEKTSFESIYSFIHHLQHSRKDMTEELVILLKFIMLERMI